MSGDASWRLMVPGPLRRLPADLGAVVAAVLLTFVVTLVPVVDETVARPVVGLAFVLFVPGYALVAALFPEDGSVEAADDGDEATGIDGIERVALSFGLSIAVVPLVGLVLNFTPWGIRLVPIVVALGSLTLGLAAIAANRRRSLPPEDRFHVPYRRWLSSARTELFQPSTRTDAALNVLLVGSVVLAAASVGYAVGVPTQGESFTEFYLLTEDEDGELVADGYPTEFVRGEPRSLVVGIGNNEHQSVSYTVIVELQEVRTANNSTAVIDESRLRRFRTEVAHNETWTLQHSVRPTMTGDRLRLQYLLYRGDAPAEPSAESAYRELHLWVNVTAAGA